MSMQKYSDQKQGKGGAPFGDIKNNDALKAAAEAGRAALKKIETFKQGEDEKTRKVMENKRYRQICNCGSWSCDIGPFTKVEY